MRFLRLHIRIYALLFCLLSTSGQSFASGPYTPPPAPHGGKKKNNDKKDDQKKEGQKKDDKQRKDPAKDGQL